MLKWHQECDWVTIPATSYRQLGHSPSRLLSRTSEAVSPGSAALAGAIQLGENLFERSTDDVDATSLLPVILGERRAPKRMDLREQPFRLKSARPIDGSDGDGRK